MFKCSNVQMSDVNCQMSNADKVTLLSERTSGVPPVIFIINDDSNDRTENVFIDDDSNDTAEKKDSHIVFGGNNLFVLE